MFRYTLMLLALSFAAGCGEEEDGHAECEAETFQCTDGVLEECHGEDGEFDEVEDCAADGLVCDADVGACVAEDTDS